MSELDDLLAGLPDDDEPADDSTIVVDGAKDSKTLADVRNWGKKQAEAKKTLAKKLRDEAAAREVLEAEANELREFKKTIEEASRAAIVADTFKALGLNEKVASLYTDEANEDKVKQWALDHGLVSVDSGDDSNDDLGIDLSQDNGQGFTPSTTGGGTVVEPTKLSHSDAMRLLASDPARLGKLIEAGRVALDRLPGNDQ